MFTGVAFAIGACLIWGLIFIVPQFMEGFSAVEVAVGRYLFYGAASMLLFSKMWWKKKIKYPAHVWKKAFLYSFIFAAGYYPCVVLGLQYSNPAITALIMGIGPITIAFYGNWREKEGSFRSLILPSVLIFAGLVMINAPALMESKAPSTYLLGLASCLIALATWSWYVVANARFLRQNREVSSSDWATLNGIATLLCTLAFVLFTSRNLGFEKYLAKSFLLGSAVLGVICSWIGIFLWNRATLYLPVSLAGQLSILETIFGLVYIYILESRLPPLLEAAGVVFFLAAIIYGIRSTAFLVSAEGCQGKDG